MNKLSFIVFLTFCSTICFGQNLVPNGGFEQYYSCPNGVSQINQAKFWTQPTYGTPDYYNQCANIADNISVPTNILGFQNAYNGFAYAGIALLNYNTFSVYREYIQVQLDSLLSANVCYHFEMYINLGDTSIYTTDDVGVYFSDTAIWFSSFENVPFSPQINNTTGNFPNRYNWTLISGNYTALGGENYITIGNFKDDLSSDSINVNPLGYYTYAMVYVDSVSLSRCPPMGITNYNNSASFSFYPNPFSNSATLEITNPSQNFVGYEIRLFDLLGKEIRKQEVKSEKTEIQKGDLPNGIYFYQVKNSKEVVASGKVVLQ